MSFGGFGSTSLSNAGKTSTFGGFGTPAATPAPTSGFGFGTTAGAGSNAPATPNFSGFGQAAASTPAQGTGGFAGFGTPSSSAPSFGFGTTTPATAKPTTTFGGFGASPSTSSISFGGFGAQNAAAKPTTGFGFGTTAANPTTPSTGFGGFGSTTPSTNTAGGFSGFGMTAKPSSFGGFGGGFGGSTGFGSTTTTAGSSGGFGPFGAPSQPTGGMSGGTVAPAPTGPKISETTKYSEIATTAVFRQEIDRTFNEFKIPARLHLDEIKRSRGKIYGELVGELRKIHLSLLQLENKQLKLHSDISPVLAEIKHVAKDVRIQGTIGLQQIKNIFGSNSGTTYSGNKRPIDEDLPCKFFGDLAERLEKRLRVSIDDVKFLNKQLSVRMTAIQQTSLGKDAQFGVSLTKGSYGQTIPVGPSHLLMVIQQQSQAFMQVAAGIAQLHKEVDYLRQLYIDKFVRCPGGSGVNPFEAADRRELAEKQQLEQRMQEEAAKHAQQQKQKAAATEQSKPASTTPATADPKGNSTGFGGFGGFGSTGLGTTGFGAPAAAPATNTAGTSGFGSSFQAPTTSNNNSGSSFAALDLATRGSTSTSTAVAPFGGFGAGAANPFGGTTGGFGALGSTGLGFGSTVTSTSKQSNPFGNGSSTGSGRKSKNKK